MEKHSAKPLIYLLIVVSSVFLVEFIIMLTLRYFPSLSPIQSVIFDSIVLVALISPVLYFFLYRPQKLSFMQLEKSYFETRENKNKFEALVNSSPDCIKLFDTKGEIIYENHKGLHKGCAVEKDGKQQCGYIQSLVEEDQKKFKQAVKEALLGKSSILEIKHVPGSPRGICMEIVTPLKDASGKVYMIFGVSRDITGYKMLEKNKEFLTQMIVHDLLNPLAAVSLEVEFLDSKAEGISVDEKRKMFRQVVAGLGEIKHMAKNLLDITLMEENRLALNKHAIDLGSFLEKPISLMDFIAAAENKKINASIDSSMPQLFADEDILDRVITNLMRNALKFSPENSSVEFSSRYNPALNEFNFSIADHGMGIPKEYQNSIFDKFVRVNSSQVRGITGKGLGLTFCKMAVESHGGKIWVESEQDKGSTFYFTLPGEH